MENACERITVDNLMVLCAKSIMHTSNRTASALSLRKELLDKLFELEFPTTVLDSALSSVPINVLLELEEELPEYASIFNKLWIKIFRKCQSKSFHFEMATKDDLPNPDALLNDLGMSKLRKCKEKFMNRYCGEILEGYASELYSEPKRLCSRSDWALHDALGRNNHVNTEIEMICVCFKFIQSLLIDLQQIDCFQDVFNKGNCFENIKSLEANFGFSSSDEHLTKWRLLLETVLSFTNVNQFTVRIALLRPEYSEIVRFCLGLEPLTEKEVVLSHASNNSSESGNNHTVSSNAILSNKEALHSIKDLTIFCAFPGEELKDFYEGVLPSCVFLEKLTINCNKSPIITIGLVKGIKGLSESGQSKLRCLTIGNGIFCKQEIITLGFFYNSANTYNKEITFDECQFHDVPVGQTGFDKETIAHGPVPSIENNSISTLSLTESCSKGYERLPYPSLSSLAELLLHFNPENLVIMDDWSPGMDEQRFSIRPIPFNNKNSRLKNITYKNFGYYFSRFVAWMLSLLREKALAVDLVACGRDATIKDRLNQIRNFKSVSFKLVECDDQVSYFPH